MPIKEPYDTHPETALNTASPWEGAESGSLILENGAARLSIDAKPNDKRSLFAARFRGRTPRVSSSEGLIAVRYRLFSHRTTGEIEVNPVIPWSIDIRGGASRVEADLTAVRLSLLRVAGGASRTSLFFSRSQRSIVRTPPRFPPWGDAGEEAAS